MKAALELRALELQDELQSIRDRMLIAQEQLDYWRPRSGTEAQYWENRISTLQTELRIHQGCLKVVAPPGDGGPDEQRRLEAREDAKREYDSYA